MSPMYNPDDWSEEFDIKLKYEPMNSSTINNVLTQYKNDEVLNYIKQLWDLIDYQRKVMADQTKVIVAIKHKVAWKRYDKEIDNNDPVNRTSVDKPAKSGNMSC